MQTDVEQCMKPYKFNVGDKVWLQAKQIKVHQQLSKLGPKQLGPFEVTEVRSDVDYKLALPPALRVHDVFHVDCLSGLALTEGTKSMGRYHPRQSQLQLKGKKNMRLTISEIQNSLVVPSSILFVGKAMGRVRIHGSQLRISSCIGKSHGVPL
jgi:hypothetical protein